MQKLFSRQGTSRRAVLTALLLAFSTVAFGQTSSDTQEANLKAYVEMLRKDLKRDKVGIVTELMQLTPEEAAKFWPLYNQYDKAITALGDERIALIRKYSDNYAHLDDATVTVIVNGFIDLEGRRNQLKRQYFVQMSKAVSTKQAARFLQIEGQIEKLVDLQIMSMLPIVE